MQDNYFKLCSVEDLEPDVPFECDGPDGDLLVVILHNDKIHAVAGECPHQQAPLADGDIADGTITCCLHFWTWRLEDGEPIDEAEMPLPVYPVKIDDGIVYLVQ